MRIIARDTPVAWVERCVRGCNALAKMRNAVSGGDPAAVMVIQAVLSGVVGDVPVTE
jgi:hypothetical protein